MFAQFFGAYLLNNNLVSADDLAEAIDNKVNTRMRLGVLAINAGFMTAEQVEHINVAQQAVDKRFGELAVEYGYLTDNDVDNLLSQQPTGYLILGQTLVNNGVLTNSEFETAILDYKAKNHIGDEISIAHDENFEGLINEFYKFGDAENTRVYVDYVTLLFKNLIRFIGDDFVPLKSSVINEYCADYFVSQQVSGEYNAYFGIATEHDGYINLAQRFSKEHLTEINEFVDAITGEFLNVNNGLFIVNESNEYGIELTLNPQEFSRSTNVKFSKTAFCIPVKFSFGVINFIVSIY